MRDDCGRPTHFRGNLTHGDSAVFRVLPRGSGRAHWFESSRPDPYHLKITGFSVQTVEPVIKR